MEAGNAQEMDYMLLFGELEYHKRDTAASEIIGPSYDFILDDIACQYPSSNHLMSSLSLPNIQSTIESGVAYMKRHLISDHDKFYAKVVDSIRNQVKEWLLEHDRKDVYDTVAKGREYIIRQIEETEKNLSSNSTDGKYDDLEKLYEEAAKCTLKEKLLSTNKEDIESYVRRLSEYVDETFKNEIQRVLLTFEKELFMSDDNSDELSRLLEDIRENRINGEKVDRTILDYRLLLEESSSTISREIRKAPYMQTIRKAIENQDPKNNHLNDDLLLPNIRSSIDDIANQIRSDFSQRHDEFRNLILECARRQVKKWLQDYNRDKVYVTVAVVRKYFEYQVKRNETDSQLCDLADLLEKAYGEATNISLKEKLFSSNKDDIHHYLYMLDSYSDERFYYEILGGILNIEKELFFSDDNSDELSKLLDDIREKRI